MRLCLKSVLQLHCCTINWPRCSMWYIWSNCWGNRISSPDTFKCGKVTLTLTFPNQRLFYKFSHFSFNPLPGRGDTTLCPTEGTQPTARQRDTQFFYQISYIPVQNVTDGGVLVAAGFSKDLTMCCCPVGGAPAASSCLLQRTQYGVCGQGMSPCKCLLWWCVHGTIKDVAS